MLCYIEKGLGSAKESRVSALGPAHTTPRGVVWAGPKRENKFTSLWQWVMRHINIADIPYLHLTDPDAYLEP